MITLLEAASLVGAPGVWGALSVSLGLFLVHLPLATGVWIVITILTALDRLGRMGLRLDPHSGDPTLGLKPVGKLAVLTFAVFAAGAVPILLANTDSVLALGINLSIFLAGVAAFFLSLYRIHREMAAAREDAILQAGERFAAVHRHLGDDDSAEALERNAAMLTVADVLERRAREIKVWPLTGGLLGQMTAIIVFVVTGLVTRAIAVTLGI